MIAICNHCRASVVPGPALIGDQRHELMRLADAMQAHMNEKHVNEAGATFNAAMNAQALFLLSNFRCTDPEFARICSESMKQLTNMMRAFRAAIESPAAPIIPAT